MTTVVNMPVRVGLIGCGMVAEEYATTIRISPTATVIACADQIPGVAKAFADRHGIPFALAPGFLSDPDLVDLVVILTPPDTHARLARAAIDAGVPGVYVEKPLAVTAVEAAVLVRAAAEKGTLLGAAPDTVLGSPSQTALLAITSGVIGQPRAATASYLSAGPERWHPNPERFHAAGIGPLVDMGTYYLSTLSFLLGSITAVHGAAATFRPTRTIRCGPRAGQSFAAHAPTHVTALLETDTGVPITFTASFDAPSTRSSHLEIHGSDATIVLPDPNFHTGVVLIRRRAGQAWSPLPPAEPAVATVERGMGVLELAAALAGDSRERICTGESGLHVANIIESIMSVAQVASPTPIASLAGAVREAR